MADALPTDIQEDGSISVGEVCVINEVSLFPEGGREVGVVIQYLIKILDLLIAGSNHFLLERVVELPTRCTYYQH